MATFGPTDLFFDIANEAIVTSLTNQGTFTLPAWYHQNTKDLRCTFLRLNTTGTFGTPYTKVPVAGLTLSVKVFSSAGALLASQSTWVADTGAATLSGVLNLNTSEMATAFTSSATLSISAFIEFKVSEAGGGETTFQQAITIKRQYDVAGSPSATPAATYLTEDQSNARFVRFSGNGDGASITLRSASGTYEVIISVNDDGTFHADVT